MKVKEYQKKAIDRLKALFDVHLLVGDRTPIVLKSPTGSGKTFMMSKVIESICEDLDAKNEQVTFIWASIGTGNLDEQSYQKVQHEIGSRVDCELLNLGFLQSQQNTFKTKQILFVNWESVVSIRSSNGERLNVLMRDSENNNFSDLLENTREKGNKICLIVDESHYGGGENTRIAQFRENIIKPDITFEMSATPLSEPNVTISLSEVIAEGMAKEKIIGNKNIGVDSDSTNKSTDSLTLLMESAEDQRLLILDNFKKVGSNVNPLVLVQVPNKDKGDVTMQFVTDFLKTKNITEENGKLRFWLSDIAKKKSHKDFDKKKISENDNEICYLIFKTAIDTGWDCPRAHILVKFRDVKSTTSIIQTIGRITRTPEAKRYNNPVLDNGYIFTNMEYFDPVDLEGLENRIKDVKVSVRHGLDKTLPNGMISYYKSRASSFNDATAKIGGIIDEIFCEKLNISKTDILTLEDLNQKGLNTNEAYSIRIMSETEETFESITEHVRFGNEENATEMVATANETSNKVNQIISDNLNGLARVRSTSRILTALSNTIKYHVFGVSDSSQFTFIFPFIANNETFFADLINESTNQYKNDNPNLNEEGRYGDDTFIIPEEQYYSSETYKEVECSLSLYNHMYIEKNMNGNVSQLEEDFLKKLDREFRTKIEWVWHNGAEANIANFGIMKKPNEEAFRPDFIIKFKDGRFGIFDTKPSDNHDFLDTSEKAAALNHYIVLRQREGINLFGGIIVQGNNDEFYINQDEVYVSYTDNRSHYKNISTVF